MPTVPHSVKMEVENPTYEKNFKNIDDDEEKVDSNDFYDWEMIPIVYSDIYKTGVTFKGESPEYLEASKKLFDIMNKKGTT